MAWHYDGEVRIKKLQLGPFGTNGYILVCPQTQESVIIDAPAEPDRILAEAAGTQVCYILITHAHFDHLMAFNEVKSRLGVPVGVNPGDKGGLPTPPDFDLRDGDEIGFGRLGLSVIHTPGHTAGSVCLLLGRHLFSGDTLFPAGPGKTATPADFEQILRSLTEKIFPLPDDTLVYPGHGPDTILGKEKLEFLVFSQRPRRSGLCGDVLWLSS